MILDVPVKEACPICDGPITKISFQKSHPRDKEFSDISVQYWCGLAARRREGSISHTSSCSNATEVAIKLRKENEERLAAECAKVPHTS